MSLVDRPGPIQSNAIIVVVIIAIIMTRVIIIIIAVVIITTTTHRRIHRLGYYPRQCMNGGPRGIGLVVVAVVSP